ncbi:MAG: undecaprenyldiphospho-muramoylpentapeptide beta-N-acetylglucosaminyltransferase [Bacilli bacterium]|nr:undecaprenyldiphospho-muramoylpentapeptide beta-N-acetylglucosaminyltransferase [Bacilli bacterium]
MRVIISAGGTGGHIYPAVAIINKIKEQEPHSQILYIGTHNRMEKDIIPEFDINYIALKVYGLKRKISFTNIKSIFSFLKAIGQSKRVIKDFNPDIVIGVGGYVTTPVVYAARKLGYKTFIHEQNSVPGLANRFLSRYADKIGISFASSRHYFPQDKTILTGNPSSDLAYRKKLLDKTKFGLTKYKKLVLIVSGSQGAELLNNILAKMLPLFKHKDYEVLYITGQRYYAKIVKKYSFPSNVKVVDFINELPRLLPLVDLIISRAGASTISEITTIGVPSILIPSPYVTNNHQLKNALELKNNGGAIIIEEKDLKGDILIRTIDGVFANQQLYQLMKKKTKQLGIPNSAMKIYNVIKDIINR